MIDVLIVDNEKGEEVGKKRKRVFFVS